MFSIQFVFWCLVVGLLSGLAYFMVVALEKTGDGRLRPRVVFWLRVLQSLFGTLDGIARIWILTAIIYWYFAG